MAAALAAALTEHLLDAFPPDGPQPRAVFRDPAVPPFAFTTTLVRAASCGVRSSRLTSVTAMGFHRPQSAALARGTTLLARSRSLT